MRLVLDPINVLPVFQRADVAEKLNDSPCAGRVLRCNDVEGAPTNATSQS
jgi:hypothetical protein